MKLKINSILTFFEIIIASFAILFDFLIPTLVILVIIGLSIASHRTALSDLGFKKLNNFLQNVLKIFGLSLVWTIFTLGVTLPILMRITGQQQDLTPFLNLKGNVSQLLIFLGFTWTLAAIGEEVVYRGYLQQKILALIGIKYHGYIFAVIFSSILFGVAHTEQGLIGIFVTFVDAIYFSLIRKYFNDSIWASVLAHGFNNTIGLVGFYFLGPVYSLW